MFLKSLPFLLFFFFFFPGQAQASENFITSYDVTYDVSETGNTNVFFDVTLTNRASDYYASSYEIEVGFDEIGNVSARDPGGQIQPVVRRREDSQSIALDFNTAVTGEGESLNFSLSFDTPEVARRQGGIWEINIPGLSDQNEFEEFLVTLNVPESFGQPSYIKPKTGTLTDLSFTKEQLGEGGISLAFGNMQLFDFSLNYHISNTSLVPHRTEIAIPPTTPYQEIFIESFSEKPLNVTVDEDGNWLAEYSLLPGQKKDILVKGQAALYLSPRHEENEEDLKKYLKQDEYWETESRQIKALAEKYKTPAEIYDYVVKTLAYDFRRVENRLPRKGALESIEDPNSSVCLEFTDLFIALSRAAGIPAREVNGYALTENSRERPLSLVQDILHAWPEYYDTEKKVWIMVDPTWGNTTGGIDYFETLDFDHFVFVRKGLDSTYPIPAGGYKREENESSKDVNVTFALSKKEPREELKAEARLPKNSIAGLPVRGSLSIENNTGVLTRKQDVLVLSNILHPRSQSIGFSEIPPFGSLEKNISFSSTSFLTNKEAEIRIDLPAQTGVSGKTLNHKVRIAPFFLNYSILLGGFLGVITIIISLSLASGFPWRLPFKRQRGESPLRGKGKES